MYESAKDFLKKNITSVDNYDEFKRTMNTKKGFIKAYWCESAGCEAKIKEETKATTRVKAEEKRSGKGKCIYCSKETNNLWYFAQAY